MMLRFHLEVKSDGKSVKLENEKIRNDAAVEKT